AAGIGGDSLARRQALRARRGCDSAARRPGHHLGLQQRGHADLRGRRTGGICLGVHAGWRARGGGGFVGRERQLHRAIDERVLPADGGGGGPGYGDAPGQAGAAWVLELRATVLLGALSDLRGVTRAINTAGSFTIAEPTAPFGRG